MARLMPAAAASAGDTQIASHATRRRRTATAHSRCAFSQHPHRPVLTGRLGRLRRIWRGSRVPDTLSTPTGPSHGDGHDYLPVKVLLVDDHTLVRQGLRKILTADPEIEIIGEAGDGESAIETAKRLRPSVVVMDIGLPG